MTFPEALRRGLTRGLAGLLLLACVPDSALARGEASVWTVKGKTNTVYFAGSVHALPKAHAEFPEQLERAYQAAKVVVLEVDLDDMNPLEAVQFITSNGTLPAEKTLVDVVGQKDYARVSKLAADLGVPEAAITKLEPWAAALVLTQFALTRTGFDANLGIDMQITERAKTDGKPIDGLETVIDQLSVFDARTFPEQTRFLLDSADDAPDLEEDLGKLIAAWRTADLQALEKEFVKERAKSPALYDALLGVRNRKWMPKIEALLEEDQDYLVVVGTLHFVGKDGLLALLKQQGHKPVPMPAADPPAADRK
ncbi:MAG TPA: TraB/GumN family protein [Steroidobacteraceae bacterium]|nr:TraB/GumN family protein [Steroidobacteraceae bacterium]